MLNDALLCFSITFSFRQVAKLRKSTLKKYVGNYWAFSAYPPKQTNIIPLFIIPYVLYIIVRDFLDIESVNSSSHTNKVTFCFWLHQLRMCYCFFIASGALKSPSLLTLHYVGLISMTLQLIWAHFSLESKTTDSSQSGRNEHSESFEVSFRKIIFNDSQLQNLQTQVSFIVL